MDANISIRTIIPKLPAAARAISLHGGPTLDEILVRDDSASLFEAQFVAAFPDADAEDSLLNKMRMLLLSSGCPAASTGILRDGSGLHKKRGPPPKSRLPSPAGARRRLNLLSPAQALVARIKRMRDRRRGAGDTASVDLADATRDDSVESSSRNEGEDGDGSDTSDSDADTDAAAAAAPGLQHQEDANPRGDHQGHLDRRPVAQVVAPAHADITNALLQEIARMSRGQMALAERVASLTARLEAATPARTPPALHLDMDTTPRMSPAVVTGTPIAMVPAPETHTVGMVLEAAGRKDSDGKDAADADAETTYKVRVCVIIISWRRDRPGARVTPWRQPCCRP